MLGVGLFGGSANLGRALCTSLLASALCLAPLGQAGQAAAGEPAASQSPSKSSDPSALVRRGRLALEQGRFSDAAEALSLAVEQDVPRAFIAWQLLGRARLRLGQVEAARSCFEEALRRAPRFAPARLGRVETSLLLGQGKAVEGELAALAEGPEPLPRAVLLSTEMALAREEFPSPIALGQLISSADASPSERQAAALLERAVREPKEAIGGLLGAVADQLAFAPAWRALAWARLRLGQRPAAIAALRVARELDEADPIAPYALSRLAGENLPLSPVPGSAALLPEILAAWERGERQQALSQAAVLLELRPHLVPLRLLQIRRAEAAGELWQVAAGYRELLDQVGALPVLSAGLAGAAETLGAHSLAACAAGAALALRPGDGSLWYLMGVAEAGLGDVGAALLDWSRALEAGYDAARVELKRGDLLFEQMRIDDALVAYRRAVTLDPDAAEVIRPFALATLTAAQQQDLAQLLELHSAAHPDNLDTLYTLATIDLRQGRLDTAERRFRRLAELAPGHLQVHYNLGQLYLRLGRVDEGRAELERFAALRARADDDWERHNQAHRRRLAAAQAQRQGRLDEELALLEESVREGTADLADRRALVVAYLAVGRPAEAREMSLSVLAQAPSDEAAIDGWRGAAERLELTDEVTEAAGRLALLRDGCAGLEGRAGLEVDEPSSID